MPLAIIALLIGLSALVAYCGRRRKFGFWGYFFASFLLTPLMGVLLIIASGPGAPPRKDGEA